MHAVETQTLHLVRHAQGYHNLSVENHSIPDPQLTPYGKEQCASLHKSFPYMDKVDLIVASPIKRTIYTALLSFASVIESKNLKVIALPELQETSDLPCDTGSSVEEIEREFAGQPVDLSILKKEEYRTWNNKKGRWAPNAKAIEARAKDARKWLMERKEKNIVVVTHGGFLHYFTEDWADYSNVAGTGWANTEFRSYNFDLSKQDGASLVETPESRRLRSGTEKPMDSEEKANIQETTQNGAEQNGYQKASEIQAKLRQEQSERDFGGYA